MAYLELILLLIAFNTFAGYLLLWFGFFQFREVLKVIDVHTGKLTNWHTMKYALIFLLIPAFLSGYYMLALRFFPDSLMRLASISLYVIASFYFFWLIYNGILAMKKRMPWDWIAFLTVTFGLPNLYLLLSIQLPNVFLQQLIQLISHFFFAYSLLMLAEYLEGITAFYPANWALRALALLLPVYATIHSYLGAFLPLPLGVEIDRTHEKMLLLSVIASGLLFLIGAVFALVLSAYKRVMVTLTWDRAAIAERLPPGGVEEMISKLGKEDKNGNSKSEGKTR